MSDGSAPSSNQIKISRSRRGCLACKRRHVKCSEQRPRCSNCLRRQEKCEYHATILPPPEIHQVSHQRKVQPRPASPTILVQALPQDTDHAGVEAFQYFCNIIPGKNRWRTIAIALKDSLMSAPKIAQWKAYLPIRSFIKALSVAHREVWDPSAGKNAPLYFSLLLQGLDALNSSTEMPDQVIVASHNILNAAEAVRTADADRLLYQEGIVWGALHQLKIERPASPPGQVSYRLAPKLRPYLTGLRRAFLDLLTNLEQGKKGDHSLLQYLSYKSRIELDTFTSLRHADAVLTNVTRRLFIRYFDETNYNKDIWFEERMTANTLLADWERKFGEFIASIHMPTPDEWAAIVMLRLRLDSSKICCQPSSFRLGKDEIDLWNRRADCIEYLLQRALSRVSVCQRRNLSVVLLAGIWSQACACRYGPARLRGGLRALERLRDIEDATAARTAYLVAKAANELWITTQAKMRSSADADSQAVEFFVRTLSADISHARVWEPMIMKVQFAVITANCMQVHTVTLEIEDSDDIIACRGIKWPATTLQELFGYSKVFMLDAMHKYYVDGSFSPSLQEQPV